MATNGAGSTSATLAVPAVPPVLIGQPEGKQVVAGQTAKFIVQAVGSAPLTYQWVKGSTPIPGATGSSYTTPAAAYPGDNGAKYSVVVTNAAGSAASDVAMEHVTPAGMPAITAFAASPGAIQKGQTATLAWTVAGATTLSLSQGLGTVTGSSKAVTPSATTTYILTATNVVGSVTATATVKVLGVFAWTRDVVYLGGKEMAEVDAAGRVHTALVDHLGTPRYVVDAKGVVEAEQKDLPFGQTLEQNGSLTTLKNFTGHEQTDASGLIYMQARYYLPMYGRFASPDPARDQHFEQTQSWNIYSYVQNNPIMAVDPNGEELVAIQLMNAKSVSVNSGTRGHVIVVDRSMVPKVAALIQGAESSGARLNITSSFRTNEEQGGLNSSNAVTPAAAGSSPHNAGLAVDGTDGQTKALPGSVVDQAEDLGLRWGGNFKKADDVHLDGVESPDQKAQLTKENQQQWKNGTVSGMTLDAKTGKMVPANISNASMHRKAGQTASSTTTPTASASKPTLWQRIKSLF